MRNKELEEIQKAAAERKTSLHDQFFVSNEERKRSNDLFDQCFETTPRMYATSEASYASYITFFRTSFSAVCSALAHLASSLHGLSQYY